MVESLPANAGDTGSRPGLGGSHMPRSDWAREPQLLSLRVWSLCSATREAAIVKRPAHRDEEWPPLATAGESPHTETKTQHSNQSINQSIKYILKETPGNSPTLLLPCEDTARRWPMVYEPGSSSSPDTGSAGVSILDFPASRTGCSSHPVYNVLLQQPQLRS